MNAQDEDVDIPERSSCYFTTHVHNMPSPWRLFWYAV